MEKNTKKNNSTLLIVIGVIAVIGLFLFISKNRSKTQLNPEENTQTEKTVETKTEEAKPGVFESIKDAIAKSLSFKCEYTTAGNKTVVYVKGNAIRIEGAWSGKPDTGAIMKDNKLWSWDNVKKEGFIIPLDMDKNKEFTQDKVVADLEAQKQFCKTTVVADSFFTPPTDIKFQDLGALLQKLTGTK